MKKKRYIITTAVPGQPIHENFYKSVMTYIKANKKTELIVLLTEAADKDSDVVSGKLQEYILSGEKAKLNDNLLIYNVKTDPHAADPTAGYEWLTHQIGSLIVPSSKQRLKPVPTLETDYPKLVMSPGSITRPIKSLNKTKKRILSEYHQDVGALVVEIENSKIYHVRQIQADKKGNFCDLFKMYTPTKVEDVIAEALIPGDWHTGSTDPKVRKIIVDMLDSGKVDKLILHDFFDGISINHHIEHKLLTKARFSGQTDLKLELMANAAELKSLSSKVNKTFIIKSNHDLFLDQWLDSGVFMNETINRELGLELALAKVRGNDPLEVAIKKYQKFGKNVKFLKEDESLKLTEDRIECGFHGHLGSNGAKGSVNSINKSTGKSVSGHTHSPEQFRRTFKTGTSTYLKVGYNKGASSWLQTHAIVYQNGNIQLFTVINGKYKI